MEIERIQIIANYMKDDEGKVVVNDLLDRLNSISFWELLSEYTKIEIPIIQRDYAQGRDDEKTKKIRGLFLDSLLKAIESENVSIELDFVYGDVRNRIFQPLDGQQRLTTLYLLYWYLAYKTGNLSLNKDKLKKFTYETRISSREFCDELVEKGEKLGEGKTLIEKITDASWFFLSWQKDPTIKAMLVMLNSIESKLNGKSKEDLSKYWRKLISEYPPITFHFKQLNDIGLTDDLYIKMNSRGKALTDFESFKARFEKHIKENEFEKDLLLTEENKEQWEELTRKTFSHKIDTDWTDLFWKYRGDNNLVDNEFVKFIASIAINSYAEDQEIFKSEDEDNLIRKILEEKLKKKKVKNITDEAVKRERIERRITLLFNNPNEIIPEDFSTEASFENLKSCFDIYSHRGFDKLKPEVLILWDFLKIKKVKINSEQEIDNNFFLDLIKNTKAEYKQRVLFYAQTQFLLKVEKFKIESFTEWMRVCRNIIQNATIDSAGVYIGAIGLINELSKGCNNIYQHLNEISIKSGFASDQVKEEIIKAKIIINDPDAKSVIHKTEDTNFCKGRIRFALYCIDYDIENDHSSVFDISKLEKTLVVINDNFSELNMKLSDEFKRAFLTIKENNYYNVWGSWSYSFNSYKRWLLNTVSDLKNSFAESSNWEREYLKELFVLLWSHSFEQIIDEYNITNKIPKWKERLIKEQNLLNGATFILIPKSNNYCKLAWQQKPSREEQVTKLD